MDCRLSFAASLGLALLGCVTSPPRPTVAEGHACGAPGMLNKVIRDNSVSPELGVKIPQVVPVVGGFEATAKVGIVNKLDANLQQIADSNQRCYFATAVTMCAVSSTDAAAPADKAAWMDLSKTFNLTMERVCGRGESKSDPLSCIGVDVKATELHGGPGGRYVQSVAPGAQYALVGAIVRSGLVVDSITPIFAPVFADGTLGAQVEGTKLGNSNGGREVKLTMPGYVVAGIVIRSGDVVDRVQLRWRRWGNPSDEVLSQWLGDQNPAKETRIEAGAGRYFVGLSGNVGDRFDAIGGFTAQRSPTCSKL